MLLLIMEIIGYQIVFIFSEYFLNNFPAGIYLLKVSNRNTRTLCEIKVKAKQYMFILLSKSFSDILHHQ